VLVDTTEGQTVESGALVVLETEEGRTYARRAHRHDGVLTLTPVNPALQDEAVTIDEREIRKIHKIIGVLFE